MPTIGRNSLGFTLVELMIAVVVVAILLAVAVPSFQDSMRKSRRSEAMTALTQVQQAQERWRSNNTAYASALSTLGLASETPSGRYEISVSAAPGGVALTNAYLAVAYGKSGTSQASDVNCRRMAVRLQSGSLSYAGCGACSSFEAADFTVTHRCWAQ